MNFGLPILACVGLFGGLQFSKRRAEMRIRDADPALRVAALRGVPVLLLTVGLDANISPGIHAEPLCSALGNDCVLKEYGALGMGYAFMFDSGHIRKFLQSKVHGDTTLFLLHGNGNSAADWLNGDHAIGPADRARIEMAKHLQKDYPCETVELGPTSWGNDASVAALDKQIGNRTNVVLVGERMGAITMWRWAEQHRDRVAALVGIMPVYSLQAMTQTQYSHSVREAYGSL